MPTCKTCEHAVWSHFTPTGKVKMEAGSCNMAAVISRQVAAQALPQCVRMPYYLQIQKIWPDDDAGDCLFYREKL